MLKRLANRTRIEHYDVIKTLRKPLSKRKKKKKLTTKNYLANDNV